KLRIAILCFVVAGNCVAAEGGEAIYRDMKIVPRTGVNPEDAAIANSIRDALERAHILGVRVECKDGAVVLTGVAEDPDAVRTAVAAARAVPGVREVETRVAPAAVFE